MMRLSRTRIAALLAVAVVARGARCQNSCASFEVGDRLRATEKGLHDGTMQRFDGSLHEDLESFATTFASAVRNRDVALMVTLYPGRDRTNARKWFENEFRHVEVVSCEPLALQFKTARGRVLATLYFRTKVKTNSGSCLEDVMYEELEFKGGKWAPTQRSWEDSGYFEPVN